jgi:hypothetical protein
MKILGSLMEGFRRSLRSWRGILVMWLVSLMLVSLVAIPIKGALIAGIGNSMITEKLVKGIDVEVFADLGAAFRGLASYFSRGLLMAMIAGIVINSFFCGGLFNCLRGSQINFSATEFFRASVKLFRPFFIISVLVTLMILFLAVLIIIIPLVIASQSKALPEGAVLKTGIICFSIFLLLLAMILLVADYSRAWVASEERYSALKALGFGIRHTSRTFFNSYGLMIILMIVQFIYGAFVIRMLAGFKPVTGGGIILLFLLSQFLFFIKLVLKAAGYGSVTRLMELDISPEYHRI